MTTPTLGVKVNGAAAQTGHVIVQAGDSVQFVALNPGTAGFFDFRIPGGKYPSGWPLPAGWTLDGTTQDIYVQGSSTTTTAFTMPALTSQWGKWEPQLTTDNRPETTDATLLLETRGLAGSRDLGYLEAGNADAIRKWVGDQQANIRIYDQIAAGAFTVSSVVIGYGTLAPHTSSIIRTTRSDATWTTIAKATLGASTAVDIAVAVYFRNTGATGGTLDDGQAFTYLFRWRRRGSAAPTQLGAAPSAQNVANDAGESTADAQAVADADNVSVDIQIKGVAGHTLAAKIELSVQVCP